MFKRSSPLTMLFIDIMFSKTNVYTSVFFPKTKVYTSVFHWYCRTFNIHWYDRTCVMLLMNVLVTNSYSAAHHLTQMSCGLVNTQKTEILRFLLWQRCQSKKKSKVHKPSKVHSRLKPYFICLKTKVYTSVFKNIL